MSQGRPLVAVLLDQTKMAKMFKYIVNRLHKLIAAEPELAARFAFTILDSKEAKHASSDFGVDASRDFAVTDFNFTDNTVYGTEILTNISSADSFSRTAASRSSRHSSSVSRASATSPCSRALSFAASPRASSSRPFSNSDRPSWLRKSSLSAFQLAVSAWAAERASADAIARQGRRAAAFEN